MEREISSTLEIAVTMIALSVLIFIIWFTVFLGKDVANNASHTASDLVATSEAGQLQEMTNYNNIMPASAAYSILRTNVDIIGDYNCYLHGTPVENMELNNNVSPCILKHLTGKVSMGVEYVETGWYRIEIHHMNCEWFDGTCNCFDLID